MVDFRRQRGGLSSGEREDVFIFVTVFDEELRPNLMLQELLAIFNNEGLVVANQRANKFAGNFVVENEMSAEFFDIVSLREVADQLLTIPSYQTMFISLESLQVNKQLMRNIGDI